jgi:putative phosphonate metabolism protein
LNTVFSGPRYAIYFVPPPDSSIYRFGASALGYDCYTDGDVPHWPDIILSHSQWAALTREPRTYGFHATLKPPFRLRPDYEEADLLQAFHAFAVEAPRTPTIMPAVGLLEGFVAVVPQSRSVELDAVAAACVQAFDRFRAPMGAEERARRSRANLSDRQIANLDCWGYPYVLEDFRFHMTLTGRVEPGHRPAVLSYLQKRFCECYDKSPLPVDSLALLRQSSPNAHFRVIAHSRQVPS